MPEGTASTPRIDAHCHYFSARYALMELPAILSDLATGRCTGVSLDDLLSSTAYPPSASSGGGPLPGSGSRSLMGYIVHLLHVAGGDCQTNYEYAMAEYGRSNLGDRPLWSVPMMMDIRYLIDEGPATDPIQAVPYAHPTPDGLSMARLGKSLEAMRKAIGEAAINALRTGGGDLLDNVARVGRNIGHAFAGLLAGPAALVAAADLKRYWPAVEMSLGYLHHLKELEALQAANVGRVYPFLAIDPRRPGAINLLPGRVSRDGPFYGVKLYPALGYLPTHPCMHDVYEFCLSHGVPVCAHCSFGGLLSQAKRIRVWSSDPDIAGDVVDLGANPPDLYFGHPDKWATVLNRYGPRGLRVNFCHFGGAGQAAQYATNEGGSWTEKIVEFMRNPDYGQNVYADVGYFTGAQDVAAIRTILAGDQGQVVRRHLLFGTDFVMMMLEPDADGLRGYLDRFAGLGGSLEDLCHANPRRYLWG